MNRRARLTVFASLVVALALLPSVHACTSPLRVEPLKHATRPPVVDEHVELARRYAPWIFQSMSALRGRQDLPAPVDFDGDLDGTNNWDNFAHYELVPTVYYACLGSETHWFLTYHLFHPRDWSVLDLGLHLTHEGDGENLQVVVEKASGDVVLLFTQAHYRGGVYTRAASGFSNGEVGVREGDLLLFDDDGQPSPDGTHPAVFVQSHGHGIYGALDACSDAALEDGQLVFDGDGLVLRPASEGDDVSEPDLAVVLGSAKTPYQASAAYRLESTTARLWPLLASGALVGDGRLLDRTVRYEDERVALDLPRYYEADRFSGPFGPDRGISPFAVDFCFEEGELGALFFDPARRYAELLTVPDDWSLEWIDYPFGATKPADETGS